MIAKRTIPLLLAAIGGFLMLATYFVPETESYGATAMEMFIIISAAAMILGGGNAARELADALTRQAASPLSRARAIFRWVADALAFDTSGQHQPQDAQSVLARRTAVGAASQIRPDSSQPKGGRQDFVKSPKTHY